VSGVLALWLRFWPWSFAMTGCGVAGQATGGAVKASVESPAELDQCHIITTPEEFGAPSDARPPVDCTEPHTTQTFLVTTFPQPLANQKERPLQEQLHNAHQPPVPSC
jgi:hypothetical protein